MKSSEGNEQGEPTLPPRAIVDLLCTLAALSPSQLALAITQKPEIGTLATSALHQLALCTVSQPLPAPSAVQHDATSAILTILTALIERGDPSLARKLIPTPGSVIDLTLCAAASRAGQARDVLERLLDVHTTAELVEGLEAQINQRLAFDPAKVDEDSAAYRCASLRSAARILASFLTACPLPTLRESHAAIRSLVTVLSSVYLDTLPAMAQVLGNVDAAQLDGSAFEAAPWQLHWLTAKVDLLQAIYRLLWVCLDRSSPLAQHDELKSTVLVTVARPIASVNGRSGASIPLLTADLLEDLTSCFALGPLVASAGLQNAKAKAVVTRIDSLESNRSSMATSKFTGAGWAALQRVVRQRSQASEAKGKSRHMDGAEATGQAGFSPDETLLVTVNSILPHLEMDRLRVILARPSFRGQSAEEVIQRLLEGDEGEQDARPAAAAPATPAPRPTSPTYVPPEPTATSTRKLVKSRANVFDDVPLDLSKASWNQAKGKDKDVGALSSDLKAAILARAEANSDDEDEEWNPFAEAAQQRTIGVEDELELDYEGRELARAGRRGGGGGDDDDDDGEGEDGGAEPEGLQRRMGTESDDEDDEDESTAATAATAATAQPSGAERERAAERVLIRHYSRHGGPAFAKDAATRKSAQRKELRQQLDGVGGRRWDDGLIESWATMFERNPRKDKLLASANDILLNAAPGNHHFGGGGGGNANHGAGGQGEERRFGPDRGRGGRIMRGGGRGGGGGGGGGARGGGGQQGGGSSSRGRGTGNSGNDRAAKMKEKRGNQARQRGFDKKVARGAAGVAGD
ncbi:uncharacterized protein PFL1_01555 [Pseudozyma flocculosa PF-1]|uniref:uncharacterized protein n=1 Tax=Pseudozyma flocculosa PF-1 TaxID=1277687 RepID=UPI0004560577|nr:uncharacterized protein PFL1_01555 [Pseudozyma flocculosa PF-1]EPQ30654.1 hypothetical protein PFL1_01555 [Pseudozyma flocculosa PF-1]